MSEPDRERFTHMLDASQEAISFPDRRARDSVRKDRMLTLAGIKAIEIVGEAARNFHRTAIKDSRDSLAGSDFNAESPHPWLL